MSSPIASRAVWFETFPQLVERWYMDQPKRVRESAGSPSEATLRTENRAKRVQTYAGIESLRPKKTSREWQAYWDHREAWKHLERVLDRLGWDVIREGAASSSRVAQAALYESERETVVIVDPMLERRVQLAKDEGLLLPLTVEDMAAITLAWEIYTVAADKMGAPAQAWVEELAPHEFARRVLGLPFSPLVFAILEARED